MMKLQGEQVQNEDVKSPHQSETVTVVDKPASAGIKYDEGKEPLDLLSPIALFKIARVMEFGREKYSAHNWRGGIKWTRVGAAALRHIFKWLGGQDKDPETGLSHLSHAGCCIMFLLEYEETHKQLDDRYVAGK